jgi:hypothetical protein
VLEGVEQRLGAVVERVVVGQAHAVDPEVGQRLDGRRRGAEEERLARVGPAPATLGDAALEVEHEQVGLARHLHDLVAHESLRAPALELPGDSAPEHRVPRKRELDRHHG